MFHLLACLKGVVILLSDAVFVVSEMPLIVVGHFSHHVGGEWLDKNK